MSLRNISILIALSGAPLLADLAIPTQAQAQVQHSKVRALNLARGTAIKINGGLSVYQPAPCMFSTSTDDNDCLIRSSSNGYTYRFLGGSPGWSQYGIQPTTETEIRITPDGRSVSQIIYNGFPRYR
ncbi:MAG: hypothetical protein AB8A45_04720 [Prochlorococcus sp.]